MHLPAHHLLALILALTLTTTAHPTGDKDYAALAKRCQTDSESTPSGTQCWSTGCGIVDECNGISNSGGSNAGGQGPTTTNNNNNGGTNISNVAQTPAMDNSTDVSGGGPGAGGVLPGIGSTANGPSGNAGAGATQETATNNNSNGGSGGGGFTNNNDGPGNHDNNNGGSGQGFTNNNNGPGNHVNNNNGGSGQGFTNNNNGPGDHVNNNGVPDANTHNNNNDGSGPVTNENDN